jgi:hypothetical protein
MRYISPEFKVFMDTFAASDGGSKLVTFQANYDAIYAESKEGNPDAMEVIAMMKKAARIIELLNH